MKVGQHGGAPGMQLPLLRGNASQASKGSEASFHREALTPVDGSPTVGFDSVTAPPLQLGASQLQMNWERRRKLSQDLGVFVDAQFRGETAHPITAVCHRSLSPAPAASSSLDPFPSGAAQADEEDVDMEDSLDDDKENMPSPADFPVPPANPGTVGVDAQQREVFRDLVLEVPHEAQEHPFSDVESDDEGEEMPENLADMLADRIDQNVDERYDFDIYIDT
jgi:hypothetical protein